MTKDHVIKFSLKNCKKVKQMDIELNNDSWVYLVKGENNLGKSTIGQAIVTMMKLENKIPDIITHGEEVTTLESSVPGPLGMYYTKMTATKENTSFAMYDPTGAKITRVRDMRNIFQYNATTVEEFVKNSYTTEGRRKQVQILASLLDPIDEARFNKMTADIDTKKGILYITRKNTKEIMESNKAILDTYTYTADDEIFYNENSKAQEYLDSLEERLTLAHKIPSKENEIEMLTNNYDNSKRILMDNRKSINDRITYNESQVNRLLKEVKQLEEDNLKLTKNNINIGNEILELDLKFKENKESTNNRDEESEDVDELNLEISKTRETLQKVNKIGNDIANFNDKNAVYKKSFDLYTKAEKELIDVREEQLVLIKKINIPGIDIQIKDDIIHVDGYALNEYQLADSKIILVVSAILAKVNHRSPILVVGKLRELDDKSLAKLDKIAKDNNCIIVGDYVENDIKNIVVEGFIPEEGIDALPKQENAPKTIESTNLSEI